QPERNTARHGVEFEGFLEQLHHKERGGTGDDEADVEGGEMIVEKRAEADRGERERQEKSEQHDERILQRSRHDDRSAAGQDLADVDLKANDEEEEHEAELGDR